MKKSNFAKNRFEDRIPLQLIEKIENSILSLIEFKIGPFEVNAIRIEDSHQEIKQKLESPDHTSDSHSKSSEHLQVSEEVYHNTPRPFYTNTEMMTLNTKRNEDRTSNFALETSPRDCLETSPQEPVKKKNIFKHVEQKENFSSNFKTVKSVQDYMRKNIPQEQYYANSVSSLKLDRTRKNFEQHFSELISNLSFSKFRNLHFLFAIYIIYILLLASTIFTSYLNGRYSASALTARIGLVLTNSERKLLLSQLGKNLFTDQLINEYYVGIYTQEKIDRLNNQTLAEALYLVNYTNTVNSRLKNIINQIQDQDIIAAYNEKNVKMYYGDFKSIFTTQNFVYMNNLKASDDLIASYALYFAHYNQNDPIKLMMRRKTYANLYNDFLVKLENIENITRNDINAILNKILNETNIVYISCFSFLGVYILAMLYNVINYYIDTSKFLAMFPNHPQNDLNGRIHHIEKLKTMIETDSKREKRKKTKVMKQVNMERKTIYKYAIESSLFRQIFAKRLLLFFVLIIPSIIMLSVSYKYSGRSNSYVDGQIQNIAKLNRILSFSLMIYHITVINMMNNNTLVRPYLCRRRNFFNLFLQSSFE